MTTDSNIRDLARYGTCVLCSAINLSHRDSCYQCRAPLTARGSLSAAAGEMSSESNETPSGVPNRRQMIRKKVILMNVGIEGEAAYCHLGTIVDITPLGVC